MFSPAPGPYKRGKILMVVQVGNSVAVGDVNEVAAVTETFSLKKYLAVALGQRSGRTNNEVDN